LLLPTSQKTLDLALGVIGQLVEPAAGNVLLNHALGSALT
jgi:hypothetical protein